MPERLFPEEAVVALKRIVSTSRRYGPTHIRVDHLLLIHITDVLDEYVNGGVGVPPEGEYTRYPIISKHYPADPFPYQKEREREENSIPCLIYNSTTYKERATY